ncbi:MAG: hypothetical protein PVI59_08555 [Anaerolineae bacterium]
MRTRGLLVGSLIVAGVASATALALLPRLVQAAPEGLPPRPSTPTPAVQTPAPAKAAPVGASIVLLITFDDDWPTRGLAWQDLWTVVEWQDENGAWHVVEGWQGGVDKVAGHTGRATWWLANDLLGRGPFRWVVYQHQGGPVMVISESFHLPAFRGGIVTVDVSL